MNNQDVSVEAGAGQFVWFPNARHTLAEHPGQRYQLRTESQLIDAIRNPMQVPKEDADCYMVSSYNGHDARSHEAQRLHGHMGALWFDADQGNMSPQALHAKLMQALGPCRIHTWATASSTPQAMRSRACVMLDKPIPGAWYSIATGAFIMILLNHHGIVLDGCPKREGQLMFGPNRGEHYDCVVGEGAPLDPFSFPGFEDLLRDCKQRYEQYLKAKANGGQYHALDDGGVISRANKHFSQNPDALMERFGFDAEDALGVDWHHKNQSSKSFATRLFQNDDGSYGWHTLSETLATSGLRSNPHGATTASGDLFAIYRWGNGLPDTPHGNRAASFLFMGEEKCGPNPPQFATLAQWLDYLEAGGTRNYETMIAKMKADQEAFIKEHPLPTKTASDRRAQYTMMPEPDGPILEVAGWIFNDIMMDPQRDIAILGAWLLVGSFAGRKDSLKSNPPVVQTRLLGINGAGKDSIRRAREKILQGLRHRADAKGDAGHHDSLALRCFDNLTPDFGTRGMVTTALAILSSLCIIPEAGIGKRSTAGDIHNVRSATMQNFAQDAYSRHTYKGFADKLPSPYGTNISYLEESTKDTFLEGLGGQVGTGEAARMLGFQIDVSDMPKESRLHDDAPPPARILDIFELLVSEAARGEVLNREFGDGKSAIPAVSMEPVPYELRRVFTFDAEAQALVDQWLRERTQLRRNNTENVADLLWAQSVRREQLILRLALVHARTRTICGPDRFSAAATVVTLADLKAGEAVFEEARRTEQVNDGDFEDPMERLVKAMQDWAHEQLSLPQPSATYKTKLGKKEDINAAFLMRKMPSTMFTGVDKPAMKREAQTLVDSGKYKKIGDAIRAAAEEGSTSGKWELHLDPNRNGRWWITDVT